MNILKKIVYQGSLLSKNKNAKDIQNKLLQNSDVPAKVKEIKKKNFRISPNRSILFRS